MRTGGLDRDLIRFTRRQLREALGFGDTQLKVHLARLVDLELVTPHRLEAGGFAYELAWHTSDTSDTGGRVLPGLLDPSTLDDAPEEVTAAVTTAIRSGPEEPRSAPGRGPVGGRSGGSRPALHEVKPLQDKGTRPLTDPDGQERAAPDSHGHDENVVIAAAGGAR